MVATSLIRQFQSHEIPLAPARAHCDFDHSVRAGSIGCELIAVPDKGAFRMLYK